MSGAAVHGKMKGRTEPVSIAPRSFKDTCAELLGFGPAWLFRFECQGAMVRGQSVGPGSARGCETRSVSEAGIGVRFRLLAALPPDDSGG